MLGSTNQALDYVTLMFDMEIGWEVKLDDCVKLVFSCLRLRT